MGVARVVRVVNNPKGTKMTKKQREYKASLVRACQINKLKRFEDDEERKAYLLSRFGVNSSKELSIDQLQSLLIFINTGEEVDASRPTHITRNQLAWIKGEWERKATDKSELALRNYINRTIKIRPLRLTMLPFNEATNVIASLRNR